MVTFAQSLGKCQYKTCAEKTYRGLEVVMSDDVRLLRKVAILYYKNDFTQHDIALRLGISRQSVGRALQRARELGIVHIEIDAGAAYEADLEASLEATFGLEEAIVVLPNADTDEAIKQAIGKGAAEFMQRRVRSGNVIGMAWSTTIYQLVQHMQPTDTENVTVVGLIGSSHGTSYPTHAEYILHRMAEMCRGTAMLLAVPAVVERAEIKASLLSDSRVGAIFDLARRSDIAVFGIGDLSPNSSPYKAGDVTEAMLLHLKANGAVGDVCGQFIDAAGVPFDPDLEERTIAVELSTLRTLKLSVAVAGGKHKVDAMIGALHGKYCNVLVTDQATAQLILERENA